MFNQNDIYSHLLNGGEIKDLYVALEKEIAAAQDRIIKEKDAKLKEKELAEKIAKAREHAFQVLKRYFSLVNPSVDDNIINSVLDTLETVEIKVNGIRGKTQMPGSILDEFFKFI